MTYTTKVLIPKNLQIILQSDAVSVIFLNLTFTEE